jgi:hypothetical protein
LVLSAFLGVSVKTWETSSVGSSPTIEASTAGLMLRRMRIVASFTGRVKETWNVVVGDARLLTILEALTSPEVKVPDLKDAAIACVRPRPSWSVALAEMSIEY